MIGDLYFDPLGPGRLALYLLHELRQLGPTLDAHQLTTCEPTTRTCEPCQR